MYSKFISQFPVIEENRIMRFFYYFFKDSALFYCNKTLPFTVHTQSVIVTDS